MKVLYAIQGTGNGHISRARDVIPVLWKKCQVDILISGTQADVGLWIPVKYRLNGLSFIFGKNGGVDIKATIREANFKTLMKEIRELPVENYDLVINDFEPVSAWACRLKKIPCISLSHQAAILSRNIPQPNHIDLIGSLILKFYAPSQFKIGFHFASYAKNIYTPVIRNEVRNAVKENHGHYTVYLPSFDEEKLIAMLTLHHQTRWHVFSKHSSRTFEHENVLIHPVSNEVFTDSMIRSTGVLCGAGFETPAEAMFLGKKLLVVPMSNQLEQQFNAAALKKLGVPVIWRMNQFSQQKIKDWIESDIHIEMNYPDITHKAVNRVFSYYINHILKKKPAKKLNRKFEPELRTRQKKLI